ncbi:MAG: NUMOD4 motif-containing HNH endonuclease [Bacteroides sp.]|nr:NUMOD4 motif-containing HNH endonuclease [Bacteroides sp.]
MENLLILNPACAGAATENWRFISGYTDYMVSDRGRVMSLKQRTQRILSAGTDTKGYLFVVLWDRGIYTLHRVHRLVGKAFLPNPDNLPQMNHLNGIRDDNRVENLEWCDAWTNMRHALQYGLLVGKPHRCRTVSADGRERHYPSAAALARAEGLAYDKVLRQINHPERVRNPYPQIKL